MEVLVATVGAPPGGGVLDLKADLARLALDLEGLDGDLQGLVDQLGPLFSVGHLAEVKKGVKDGVPRDQDVVEIVEEGRSEVGNVLVGLANKVRVLRGIVRVAGGALEL